MICENVLKILKQCDSIDTFDTEMNRINSVYKILEQAYSLLGINGRMDKCIVLKDIIEVRDKYFILIEKTAELKYFPLCHCLCNLNIEENNRAEFGFIYSNFNFIKSKIKSLTIENKDNFYKNNWLKFIQFLRNIIRQIELDKLTQSKNELSKLNAEVQRAKANFHERREKNEKVKPKPPSRNNQNAGPAAAEEEQREYGKFNGKLPAYLLPNNNEHAKNPKNYRPPPNLLRPVGRQVNQKQKQPSRNNQKDGPAEGTPESRNILLARLAALKND